MSVNKLKPCPFCGELPAVNHIEPHSHSLQIGKWKMPDHPGSCVIECVCGAGLIDSDFDTVAARWNTRTLPPPEVKQEPVGFLRIFKLNGKICDKTFIEKIPTGTIFEAELLKPYCVEYHAIFDLPPEAEALKGGTA